MNIFYSAISTYFGAAIRDTIMYFDIWLGNFGYQLRLEDFALIFNLLCTTLTLLLVYLFFKTLWKFTKSLIQWGVNKLWI